MRRSILVAAVFVGLGAIVLVGLAGGGYLALKQPQRADPPSKFDTLAKKLQAMNPEARLEAIGQLGKCDAKTAVPALVDILAIPDEELRLHAAMALGEIGEAAVPALIKALGDEDEMVRIYAIWALGFAGPAASSATPDIIKALRDDEEEVRYKAVFALGRVGLNSDEAVAALVGALKDKDRAVWEEAVASLARLGPRAIPEALRAFDADDMNILEVVFAAFGTDALPVLRQASMDKRWLMRFRAVHAMGAVGLHAEMKGDLAAARTAVDELLIPLVRDDDSRVRLAACKKLGWIQARTDSCGPALEKAFLDDSYAVSSAAYYALVGNVFNVFTPEQQPWYDKLLKRIDSAQGDEKLRLACLVPRRHVKLLEESLKHSDEGFRLRIACALASAAGDSGRVHELSKKLVPFFTEALTSPQATRRRDAARGLWSVAYDADGAAYPVFLRALKDDDRDVYVTVAEGLTRTRFADPEKYAAIMAPLVQDPPVRFFAFEALRFSGAAAVPQLTALLKDKDIRNRVRACELLIALKDKARAAVPSIVEMAKDAENRVLAAYALEMLAPERSFDKLLDAMQSDKTLAPSLRRAAKGGNEPGSLVGALIRDLKDPETAVAHDAAVALEEVVIIMPRQNWQLLIKLGAIPAFESALAGATRQLAAGEPRDRRHAAGLVVRLGALTRLIERRMQIFGPRLADDSKIFAVPDAIDAALQLARNDSDSEVRRVARHGQRAKKSREDIFER